MENCVASSIYEQVRLHSHKTAELIEAIFYGNDKAGLELLIRHLEFFVEHAKSCVSCLEFVGDGENPYKKIQLLLGYLGHEGISEDFVSELEEITDQAHEYLETEEDKEEMKAAEQAALENMRMLLDKSEKRAATEDY